MKKGQLECGKKVRERKEEGEKWSELKGAGRGGADGGNLGNKARRREGSMKKAFSKTKGEKGRWVTPGSSGISVLVLTLMVVA